jgi:hypothetical protein
VIASAIVLAIIAGTIGNSRGKSSADAAPDPISAVLLKCPGSTPGRVGPVPSMNEMDNTGVPIYYVPWTDSGGVTWVARILTASPTAPVEYRGTVHVGDCKYLKLGN